MKVNDTIEISLAALKKHLEEIDKEIEKACLKQKPETLYEPIRYILSTGGKRIRPLLTLFGCYLFSGSTKKAILPGIGIELFHNFTLIHDDIMDKAPLRRGNKTIHEKWDLNVAILSGDTMLFKAYQYLIQVDEPLTRKVIALFNQCAIEVCEGQQFDMDYESRENVREEEYLNMIKLKTAAVLGFSLQLGALVGGARLESTEALKNFGISIGIGFQLKDDLLDVFGDQDKFGKQVGGDIIANKKTYLLIKALELSSPEQKEELRYCLNSDLNDKDKVARVTKLYNQLNIKEITEQKINDFFDIAFTHLEEVDCPQNRKNKLADFSKLLINREN